MKQTNAVARMGACSANQVRRFVEAHLERLWAAPEQARTLPPLLLWGPPGVGKSSILRDLASDRGIGLIDVRLAQREPVDLRGLPVPKDDGVHWIPSSDWPRDPVSRGILLLDEITAADRSLQAAAYELILDRRLGDTYQMPQGWLVVAAGNRPEDQAVSLPLSSALANRFCHLELLPDLDDWISWAVPRGIHPDVVGFLRFRPDALQQTDGNRQRGWATPRSWERVSLELDLFREDPDLLRLACIGLLGEGIAHEFLAFRAEAARLPDIEAMLDGNIALELPARADRLHAFVCTMLHHLFRDPQRHVDGFLSISERLPSEFAAWSMIEATGRFSASPLAEAIVTHPAFTAWTAVHGSVFRSPSGKKR